MSQQVELLLPKPHWGQQYLLENRRRFNAIKCGRRWGKTETCQELFLESFESSHFTGYFAPTYKDLNETWKETLDNFYPVIQSKNEQLKQVIFINGAQLDFWSMEDPNSGRGRKYHRAIMDECEKALNFQSAWEQSIAPTLTDYGGDAYFLSTPKFGATFFKEICRYAKTKPDLWATFIYTTYDNPHIPKEEIEIMRSILPDLVFRCEYLAEDLDGKTPSPFAHQFDAQFHVSDKAVFQQNRRIILSIDFNLQPFACQLSHIWEDAQGYHDHTFDEIEIAQGSLPAMADEIKLRYSQHLHKFEITGDYMGKRGDLAQRDNSSLYFQLIKLLGIPKQALKLTPNPTHENSKADVNFVLWKGKQPDSKISFLVNSNCKSVIFDLTNVQWDDLKGEISKRNRKDDSQRADQLDATRYRINTYWRPIIKRLQ